MVAADEDAPCQEGALLITFFTAKKVIKKARDKKNSPLLLFFRLVSCFACDAFTISLPISCYLIFTYGVLIYYMK
jgi:hypothetical protein